MSAYLHLAQDIVLIAGACLMAALALVRHQARAEYACWAVGLLWLAATRV